MKPDWKDAPEWAEWIAQDYPGIWSFHQNEPKPTRGIWDSTANVLTVAMKGERVNNEEWKSTLERRPKVPA